MATIFDSYLGVKDETVYGTAVVVDKFFEFNSESIEGAYERIESESLRAGSKFLRSDRFVVNPKGAAGGIDMEVMSRQFGTWFKHCLGTVSSGTAALGVTKHTFTPGDLVGKSFTVQVGRPGSNGAVHPFTYEGGKVMDWELKNSVDGLLMLTVNTDFEAETNTGTGAYAAQSPVYAAADNTLFSFINGVITIGGVAVKVTDVSIKGTNGLKADRYYLGAATKREQLEAAAREISFDLTMEFEDLTQFNRVKSATSAGALATFSADWTGVAVAGGGLPKVTVTMPAARFDTGAVNVGGRDLLTQSLSGKALYDGTNPAITVEYTTPDTTV